MLDNELINQLAHKALLSIAGFLSVIILPVAFLLVGQAPSSSKDPTQVLIHYLKAAYARDFGTAYRFISAQDKRLKSEKVYVRDRGPFTGFTLEMARRLAAYIEATPLETNISDNRAHVKLQLKLPDANKLSPYLFDWDEDRLNSLSTIEQRGLLKRLREWRKEGRLPRIDGDEAFELIKESKGWKVFLNWAAGVRIIFGTSVPPALSLAAMPTQKEVTAQPGELFTIAFSVRNLSEREVLTRIAHPIEPKAIAEYLDIVECGLIFPVKLSPKEKAEYSSTYIVRGDIPLSNFTATKKRRGGCKDCPNTRARFCAPKSGREALEL